MDPWAGHTFDIDGLVADDPRGEEGRGAATEPPTEAPAQPASEEPSPRPGPERSSPAEEPPTAAETRLTEPAPDPVQEEAEPPHQGQQLSGLQGPRDEATADSASRNRAAAQEPSAVAGGSEPARAGAVGDRSGSYGAAGLPEGVRDLAYAFLRALPQATHSDPVWDQLPLGYKRTLLVILETNAQGHVIRATPRIKDPESTVPGELVRLVRRTVAHLGQGRFALPDGLVSAGTQALKIELELEPATASDDPMADPQDVAELHHDPNRPSATRPSRAFFRKNSGRKLEMRVWTAEVPH